jgi:RNA polymerase sigma-70 factor (ECF subfamily)
VADDPSIAFARECLRHLPDVKKLVLMQTGDPELAEDIAQETWFQAYRYRHTFDAGYPLAPWLFTVARRTQRRMLHKHGSTVPLSPMLNDVPSTFPDPNADPAEQLMAMEGEFLWAVRPRYRRALLFKYVLHLTYEEIAKLEGIAFDSARTLMQRSRAALNRVIEQSRKIQILLWLPLRDRMTRIRSRFTQTSNVLREIGPCCPFEAVSQVAAVFGIALTTAFLSVVGISVSSPRDYIATQVAIVIPSDMSQHTPDELESTSQLHFPPNTHAAAGTSIGVALPPTNPFAASATTSFKSSKDGNTRSLAGRIAGKLPDDVEQQDETSVDPGVDVWCDAGVTTRLLCEIIDSVPSNQN